MERVAKRCVLAFTAIILVAGCEEKVAKPESQDITSSTFRDFVDRWNAFHVTLLVDNSKWLAARLDPKNGSTSKTEKPTPRTVLVSSFRPTTNFSYMLTPAYNTFAPHLPGGGAGLIGTVSEEAARLRIWLADRKASASWFYFRLGATMGKRPSPLFVDSIGDNPPSAREKELAKIVTQAEQDKADATRGKSGSDLKEFLFETRKLRFSDPSCIRCHPSKKLGDVAGTMVYVVRVPEVPVKGK